MAEKLSPEEVDSMIASHERALFGYTDRGSLRIIPGLLARIDDAHKDIGDLKVDLAIVKATVKDVPEIVQLGRSLKRWGSWGVAAIIALLLALVFHQYGLIPILMHAMTGA